MSSLYEMTNEYKTAEIAMAGMDEQTMLDTLEGLRAPIEEKSVNVAKFIRNQDSEIAAIDNAVKEMQARSKCLKSKRDAMINYLKKNMEESGIDRLACPYFELAIVKNPAKLVLTGSVPDNYMIEVPSTKKVDNAAIKKACKDGTLSFAHLETSTRLRIK